MNARAADRASSAQVLKQVQKSLKSKRQYTGHTNQNGSVIPKWVFNPNAASATRLAQMTLNGFDLAVCHSPSIRVLRDFCMYA